MGPFRPSFAESEAWMPASRPDELEDANDGAATVARW